MNRIPNNINKNTTNQSGPTIVSLPPLPSESTNPFDDDDYVDNAFSSSGPVDPWSSSVPLRPSPAIAMHGITVVAAAAAVPSRAPPARHPQYHVNDGGGVDDGAPSPRLASTWDADAHSPRCRSCHRPFDALFQRRHHCRLCGRVFCHDCSDTRSLIPPSALVLRDGGGDGGPTFAPNDDACVTYVGQSSSSSSSSSSSRHDDAILRGRGLEARVLRARDPQRTCAPCRDRLAPLQGELRSLNSNAVRYNYVDEGDAVRRMCNSPLAFTLGHEVRKAAYALGNLLPGGVRGGGGRSGPFVGVGGGEDVIYSYHPPPGRGGGECHVPDLLGPGGCRTVDPTMRNIDGMRIPPKLLARARGVAIVTSCKGGLGFAGFEFGTGLVVARRTDPECGPDDWSAPSAIGVAGFAWGALLGAQVSDHVFLLMTDDAVRLFASEGGRSIQLGADVGVALGPLGRTAEADLGATAGPSRGIEHGGVSGVAVAPIFTYSLSKGLYAGVSLDGRLLMTRDRVNEKFYGGAVSAHELLSGRVPNPPAAQPLYDALKRCRVYGGGGGGDGEFGRDDGGYMSGSRNLDVLREDGYEPENNGMNWAAGRGGINVGGVGGLLEHLSHTTGMGLPATPANHRYSSLDNQYNLYGRDNITPGFS
ncbi:hypothetical protein ACHAW5_001553 [Stephanodiscus triporus]|uniref:FYVE-type domain-containing protein n=1 Tax=Stephanodiscus triporus TaxID=2934178 RepID=A0ABD3NI29_9STRA